MQPPRGSSIDWAAAAADRCGDRYNGGFGVDLMLKDISLAIGAARGLGQATPTAATAQQLYQILSANGMGGKDFGSVITLLQGKFEKK